MSDLPLIDFGFLEELSDGDAKYKYELLGIFLSTAPDGVANLEKLVKSASDYEAIYKQAHALKSSFGVIKVRGMHEGMAKVEALARGIHEGRAENVEESKEETNSVFRETEAIFNEAMPLLIAERDKNKPPDAEEYEV